MTWAILGLALAAIDLGEKTSDGVTAALRLTIPREGAGPARARVRFDLEISGPANLQVEFPRLEDAFDAWRIRRALSCWREQSDSRVVLTLHLEQTRPGPVGLPSLALRVRAGPEAPWDELLWDQPLHELKDVAPIEPVPSPAPANGWPWVGLILAVSLLLLVLVPLLWRRAPREVQQSARQRALTALEGSSATFDDIETVLRDFLSKEHGVAAARTASELRSDWPLFAEVLLRCERARFSGVAVAAEELEDTLRLARQALAEPGVDTEDGKLAKSR